MTRPLEAIKPWVADTLTLANGVFGFLAVLTWSGELGPFQTIPNEFVAAAYIGLGLAADGIDGIVARAWGSTGLGEALDAINDALTFSVAPAVFLIGVNQDVAGLTFRTLLYLVAVAYVVAGMLRLARHQDGEGGTNFEGLPTPWSAAALVAVLLVDPPAWAGLLLAGVLAVLNLSSVPYPKTRGPRLRRAALVLVAVTLLVIAALVAFPISRTTAAWGAVVVALGLILTAPLAAR